MDKLLEITWLWYILAGLAGYLIGTYAFDKGVISTVPLIIIGVGFLISTRAVGPITYYRQHMVVAKMNKTQLDELLLKYQVEYEIEVNFQTDFLGNKEASTKLRFL